MAIFALCLNPISSALVTITLRALKGVNPNAQAFHHALFMTVVMGLASLIVFDNFAILHRFESQDYLYLFLGALFALINQILKQMAVQNDKAARVTIYNYT